MENDNYSSSEQNEYLSDDEEEAEPKLQYERLAGDLPGILRHDAASCIAVHPKIIALGMHSGVIYILDHQGNNSRNGQLKLHTRSVTQISIDASGEYLASCSNDGKVVVQGLYSCENIHSVTFDCPVEAVALDPNFHRSRLFITCTDEVILYERTFLLRYKKDTLYEGEGIVHCVTWNGRFAAFATDLTTVVYDMQQRDITSKIKRGHDPKLSLYRCNLSWQDDRTLLVGWADTVKVCKVKPYEGTTRPPPECLSDYYVEIVSMFTTDFFITGLAPLGMDTMAALTLLKEEHRGGSRPELRVLKPLVDDYIDQSSDILTVRGFASYRCADYHLESLPEEGLFFIVSPKDIIVAKPRDEDGHVAWLLEHGKYEEALAAASSRSLVRHTLRGIGEEYIVHLLSQEAFVRAAEVCALALGQDKALWEANVYRFAQHQQLRALAPYLPQDKPRLDPTTYEIALNEFLQQDPQGFLDLVSRWNSNLYSVQTVVNAVLDRLSYDPTCVPLLQALAKLYTYQSKFDLAMSIYLKIGASQEVFQLVESYGLSDTVQEKLLTLMVLDTDKTIALLLDRERHQVPMSHVVEKLREKPQLLYRYLDAVLTKNPTMCESYHLELATLYAEFDPTKLLPLLRSSNNYPLEEALHLCQKKQLIPEVVFLLGRMGNTKEALQHIMQKLADVQQAIVFCKENNDIDLWKDLIAYSLDKPHFITTLLHSIGTHVDPILLIKRIPEGLHIPRLRDALVKILRDYNLQISLREGCKKILVSDCITLLSRLNRQHSRAVFVDDNQMCHTCDRKLLFKDVRQVDDVVVFFCKHTFHRNCLPMHGNTVCTICSLEKSRWFGS